MGELLSTVGPLLNVFLVGINILLGYTTLKQRKAEPHQKEQAEIEEIKNRQDNDNRRLKDLEEDVSQNKRFRRVSLEIMRGMLKYFEETTTNGEQADFKKLEEKIDKYFLDNE